MSLMFLLFGITVIGILVAGMYLYGVSPTPTLPRIRKAVLAMVPADVKFIGELGSGWGGMSLAFAGIRPSAQITGFEQSPLPYLISRQRVKDKNITILREDFFNADLSQFDMLYCYLTPQHMVKLKPLIKSGTVVISNAFPMPGWQPAETQTIGRLPAIVVFRYIAP